MALLKQCAALAYVETEGEPLVLLITTRGRGRWSIPKGWTKPNLSDRDLAAREALEEAGVAGEVSATPIGNYVYTKRLHFFSWARCSVDVYLLHAITQQLSWPERASRRFLWTEPQNAAKLVRERKVADMIRTFPKYLTASH